MFKRTAIGAAAALVASSLGLAAGSAWAQDTQRVEITGSAIKRVDVEGALPVTIITREEITRSGVQNTEDLVATLGAVSSIGGISLSTGAGSTTYGQSTISLRGLSGDRTLVLVNGRRVAAAAGGGGVAVNINNIPLSAIERVEVLKDGASSLYGSDALAGVVNFILTKDFKGFDIGIAGSKPTRDGGGDNYRASIVAGFGDLSKDRFNLTLSGSLEKTRQLMATDRAFAATGNQFPWIVAGATGQGNIEGGYNPGTGSVANGNWVQGTRVAGFGGSPGSGFGNPLAAPDKCADIAMFKNPTNTTKGAPYCAFDSSAFVALVPDSEATSFTANGVFRLSDKMEFFGDALYSRSIVTQRIQTSPVRRSFLTSDDQFLSKGIDPVLLISPSNPNYAIASAYLNGLLGQTLVPRGKNPDGTPITEAQIKAQIAAALGKPLAITARVFDFGPRTSKSWTTQTRVVGGLRGNLGAHEYEIAYSSNESKAHATVPDGYFSQTEYAKAVQNSNEWNPWSLNQTDGFKAAIAPAKYTGTTQDSRSTSKVLDGLLRGDAFSLPAGAVQYAAGLQFRDEKYKTDPSAALFSGDIAGLGGATPPVDRARKITSAFGELNVPLIKGLEGNVSMRNDRYNDVGNSNTYKASLRWQPTRQLLLRGSTGTGFRAPSLSELWLPQTVGTSAQFTDPADPNNPNLQVPELSGGNPNLKPEKSKQSSLGIVFSPTDALTLSLDLWKIDVEGLITTPSTQEIVSRFRSGDPAYATFVTLDGNNNVEQTVSILSNVGAAKLSGIDLEASFRQAFAAGRLDLNLNGTYMIKFDQVSPGGSISRKVGTQVEVDPNGDTIPVLEADGGGVVLRWKHKLSATWTTGPWGFTLAQNFYTGYRTGDRQIDGVPNFVPDQSIYDANVTYNGIKNLKLAVGVKNLFDKDPPIYVPVSNQFAAGYDISQYDPRSRYVYFSANYKF